MGGKAAIGGGLVMGLLVGAGIVAGVVLLTPGPVAPTRAPVVESSPSPPPTSSPAPSPSASASPDASDGSPSASPPDQASGIGEPARTRTAPQPGGADSSLAALDDRPLRVGRLRATPRGA